MCHNLKVEIIKWLLKGYPSWLQANRIAREVRRLELEAADTEQPLYPIIVCTELPPNTPLEKLLVKWRRTHNTAHVPSSVITEYNAIRSRKRKWKENQRAKKRRPKTIQAVQA